MKNRGVWGIALVILAVFALPVQASLTTFYSANGNVAVSTDGWGSTSQSGVISAFVPIGSTVQAAFLYTSIFNAPGSPGGTLNGTPVPYGPTVVNTSQSFLGMARADVTSIV